MNFTQSHAVRLVATKLLSWPIIVCTVLTVLGGALAAQDAPNDSGAPGSKGKPAYFPPEHFPVTNEWEAFRNQAHAFLKENPDDELAPTALRDLIMIESFRAKSNPAELNALKVRALLDYPESFASLITLRSFKGPLEFRNTLLGELRKPGQMFTPDFCRRILKSCEIALTVIGPNSVDDDDFLLLISSLMKETKSYRLRQLIELKWPRIKEPVKSAIEVCNDDDLSPKDKLIRLHQIATVQELKVATPHLGLREAERFWMTRLQPEDRKLPTILEIQIERKLELKQFKDAMTNLKELLAIEKQPKWMFWYGWCLATEQQFDEGLAELDQLSKLYPKDNWASQGTKLAELIRERDAAYRENSDTIQEIAAELQSGGLDLLQLNVVRTPSRGKPFELWATADAVNHSLDVFINQDSKPLVGYQTTLKGYSIFLRDQGKIIKVNKPGVFPDIMFGLNSTPQGMNYNLNFNMASTVEAAVGWRRMLLSLLKHPAFADEQAILTLLRHSTKSTFPSRVKKVDDRRVFVWYTPDIHRPEMSEIEIEVFPKEQHRFEIRVGSEYSAEVAYGKVGSLPTTKNHWDNLPIIKKEELDFATIMQAVNIGWSVLQTQDNPEPTPTNVPPAKAIPTAPDKRSVQPIK